MVTENGQSEGNTSFLRASRNGQLDKVLEFLKSNIDINTSNANGLNALHLASKDGHVEIVEELLKRGAVVDAATKKGNTALHIASLAGQEEVVKILVQHGASVNVQSQNGFTPLYMAAQENHDNVVKFLLANGANQSLSTEDGFTPLAVAMQQGHDKVVAVLLENDTRGRIRLPALHIAAKKDDVKAAKLLLENDHNADVTSKSGFTPLHIASHYGNQQIANLLIQKGADVNYAAKHNITPVHVAAKWGKANMVALLLEHGAIIDAKTRDGLTPLHCAARSGHEQVVDMLLERGAPISSKTKNGLAPLHMAAQGDHIDAARILLYHRAPVDEVTVDYLTALHVAAHCGHVRVAKLLLDRQADANARALNGFTPLHIACKKNRIKVVELLLKHGANIGATTESGLTPLHVASFMGCMNIAIYLLQHEANPNVPTVRGETPLHLAARANQTDIIRILLRNGAQVDVRAREQQTPLHIASRLGNVDIVMLLLQHGAKVDSATKDMYTALHIAAKEDQDEVAAILIENGATLNAVTKKGFTPLHLAAKYGHLKVAKLLLQKETPVDAQGKNGVTPLHIALHYDKQDVALFLLDKGASPHTVAKNGHTPLHIAARKNQMDIAHTLLEYEANPDAESKAGFVPLHLSAQEGHAEMSSLILEHKADVNHEAKNGLTPLHLCAQEDSIEVAEVLVKYGVNVNAATKSGYTPLHIASHYDQIGMVKFLLRKGAKIEAKTALDYTPLHHAAQQGHANVVNVLLSHQADPNAVTTSGQTPLMIAQKLGYITVIDTLKAVTNPVTSPKWNEEKYRVQAPELMHETFMSDSEEEGGEDAVLVDQTYRYLTADEMKSLGDDSLPIDVTRDERIDSNRVVASMDNNALPPQHFEDSISPEHISQNYMEYITKCSSITENTGLEKYPVQIGFLVSFLVDARGGAMRGCRHSGVRVIVPPRCASSPTRITCRYVRPQRTPHPPPLMEGEALASRVLELGPTGVKFLGPVIIEVPHFAALRNKEREIVILRSDNGESWKEHSVEATEDILHEVLRNNFEADDLNELEDSSLGRITRIVTQDFPQYFAVVSRVRQEVHAIGPEGGMVSSTVVPQVQAVFPEGALTKKIKVGLQAQPIDPELSAKLLGHGVAVSPVVTVEPRRRKFHKAITLTMPAPKAHSQGMINQYSGSAPTLRLLCSITGGTTRAQWEDVTGSTPLTFVNDCVSFTTTVSARFWLMDCRNISDATKMATELYKEAIHVPFMAKFVVFAKRVDPLEARLRVFCMTDDKEDKTLEQQEQFTEVAKSRDVEVLEGKQHYIEFAGNLVPITKSGEQLSFCFRAFKENRLPFSVRIKDQHAEAVSRCLFMKEPKVPKGEPPQQPICILNIVLPDDIVSDTVSLVDSDSYKKHSNISENYYYYRQDPRMADMSNLLGEDWISLANQLGLTPTEMDVIKSEYPDSTAKQAQSMLRMWLSQSSKKGQMNTLENALWRIGRGDIVSQCLNDEGLEIIPRAKKEISSTYRPKKEDYERDNNETKVPTKVTLEDQEGGKRTNIRDKYLAEEKEQWEEEEEEESFDKPVAERRKKIQKRLSAERTIPASSQRREIVQEITTIKQQSLVEDKLAEVQQKVIEHEEKTKTVLSKTTTSKTDQVVIMNNKESTSLEDERTISSEIAHKTAQDMVLMEGIAERLNKKETIRKHISAEDGQKSPKFSKTPPPSPADFLFKEQTYASEDSIPHIAVTQEADDEETEYLTLAEVATDIEDLEEESKPRAKKNKTLKIKLGTDENVTDQEDAEGSDDNRGNYDYKSDPEMEKQFQEIEVGEEVSEESFQEKGKRAKKHSTLRKSGSFVSDMKTYENYTDEETFYTDNELQLGEDAESNFNVTSYDVAITNMRESRSDADNKTFGLRVSNHKGYLSAPSISPNLSDITDVEIIDSDAEDDKEVKKTNKVKRKKRKNLPEKSYTEEEVELSDEETNIKKLPRQKPTNKFKSTSLNYSSDNEENYPVFPICKKVAEKGTILNIPDFNTDYPTDVEDFVSPTEETFASKSESLSDAEFEKEMKQVTDAYGQIFTSDKIIEKKKKDSKRVLIEEEGNDLNIIDLTDKKTLFDPEKFEQEVEQIAHRSTDEEEFVDDDPPEPKVYHDLPLPTAARNMTIFSEKGTFPTVTILPLDNIERGYETQDSRGPETDEESITEADEPLDLKTPTDIPNMDWEITTVRENSLDKTKNNLDFLEIEETFPKIHKRRKPPKFKYLYQKQLNRQNKQKAEDEKNYSEDVVIIEDDTEDQPITKSNDNTDELLEEQVVTSSDEDYGSPTQSRTPTPNKIKNSVSGQSNENSIGHSTTPLPSADQVMYLKGGYFPELKSGNWTTYFWIENYTTDNNLPKGILSETELARKDEIKTGQVDTADLTSKHRSGRESYHSSFLASPLSYFVSESQPTIVRNPFNRKNNTNFEGKKNLGAIPETTCTKEFPEIFYSNNDDDVKLRNCLTNMDTVDFKQSLALGNLVDNDDLIFFNNEDETSIKTSDHVESKNSPFLEDAKLFDEVDTEDVNKINVENEDYLDPMYSTRDATTINEEYSLGFNKMEDFCSAQNNSYQSNSSINETESVFSIKEFAVEQTILKQNTSIETSPNSKTGTPCQTENEIISESQFTSDLTINPSEDALINIPVKKKIKLPKQLFVLQQGNITDIQFNTLAREKFLIDFEGAEDIKGNSCKGGDDLILLTPEKSSAFQDVNKRFNGINTQSKTSSLRVETKPKDMSDNPHIFSGERQEESVLLENTKLVTIYENDCCDTTSLSSIPSSPNINLSLTQDPIFCTETIGVEEESTSSIVNVVKEKASDMKSPDVNRSSTYTYFKEKNDTIEDKLKIVGQTEGETELPTKHDFLLLENYNDKILPSYIISETAAQTENNIRLTDQSSLAEIPSKENAVMTEFGVKSECNNVSSESTPLLKYEKNTNDILQSSGFIIAKESCLKESSNKLESPNIENVATISNQSSKNLSEKFNADLEHFGNEDSMHDGLKSEINSNKIFGSQNAFPQYVSYFKHKEGMRKPYEIDDDTKNVPIISTIVKHELTGESNIISLDNHEHANTSTLNLSPSTNVLIEVPVKRKLKIPKRTKLNVEDTPLGENFEFGVTLGPDQSRVDEFKDRCRSSLHFALENPVIIHDTDQNIAPESNFLNLNPCADVLIEVPVKKNVTRPKLYTNYSELITGKEDDFPEKQSVKSSESDKLPLAENVDIVHSYKEENNFRKEPHPPSQSIWWEGAFRDLETAKEDGLAEHCEIVRQTDVIEFPKLSNSENLINFTCKQPEMNSKANVQLLIKPTNRNDPIEVQSVKNFSEKRSTRSKTIKKCSTLPHRSSRSEPIDRPKSNSKGKMSSSFPDLLLTSDSDDESEESLRSGNTFTLPTIFSKSNKGSNRLLSVQKTKYPLQCIDKSPLQRRKNPVPKVPQQSLTPKLDSSTPPDNPSEYSSPIFHLPFKNHPHPDVYCDWVSQKIDVLNHDKTCHDQLTEELTATNTEPPLPKPRPSKLPTSAQVWQSTGLPDKDPEKPLSPVRDDLLDREDVPETYHDKKKFWENVSQEHSQKRLSYQEPTAEKNIPKKRISVPDFSNIPVPKLRTVLQTSQSLIETESKSEGAASYPQAGLKGAVGGKSEDDMFLDRRPKPAKKKTSAESDYKGSGHLSEGPGYISDSEDVENNISDSEIEDRVPQIRDRMMSVFVPSGSSTCRIMRSASLPTEDLYEVSARTIKARKEYYEEQIRKEMIEEQLTSEIEEEHSPERKNLLSSTEEDRTEADAKSIGEDMEEIKEDHIKSSTKSFHGTKIHTKEPKVAQDVDEKPLGIAKKLELDTVPNDPSKEDTHKIEIKVTPTTTVENIADATIPTDSEQKSHELYEDQPTPIKEDSQINANDNERSMLESQLNLSLGRSDPLMDQTNLKDDSHSVTSYPQEVLVDKSEIEGSEKLAEFDPNSGNGSVDLSHTEILGDNGTAKLKYGEIKLKTASKSRCEIDISEQAEEFILPEIVAERIDFSSKVTQETQDTSRVPDTKETYATLSETKPKIDVDSICIEKQTDAEKSVVGLSDKKDTSEENVHKLDKTVVEIHETRSIENQKNEKDKAAADDSTEKPIELVDDIKAEYLKQTPVESTKIQPKPGTTKSKPDTDERPSIAEGQTNIEKLIYDCLQQQKVDADEAHKIANALVGEIEAEIQKQDALEPAEKIISFDDNKYIPESLKRLAEIKGLDAREIELVESVLERRQRGVKLTRDDTQISSVEITDEELKYSGGEFDYSQVLEQQVNQLKQEKGLAQPEMVDEAVDDIKSNAKSVDINEESSCKEKEWLRDNETIKGDKKISVQESGTVKSTEAVSSEKLNMQDTTIFQIGDKEATKIIDEKSNVIQSQAEVTIEEKIKISTDESETTATNLDTTQVKSHHKAHTLEDELTIKDKDSNTEFIQAKTHNLNMDNTEIEQKLQQATTEITGNAIKHIQEKTEDKYNELNEKVEDIFRETSSKVEERDDGSRVKIQKEVDKVQSTTQSIVTKVYHEEKISTSISQEDIKDDYKVLGGFPEKLDEHKTIFENQAEILNVAQLQTEIPPSYTPTVVLRKSKSDADTSSGNSVAKVDRKSGYDFEVNSSSGESHYHSFEMESGKSRPCSSDIEGFVAVSSSEYESALTSQVYSARSQISSTDYQTPVSTLSSKESMKSLDSEGSDNLASVEVTEHSETLVPSTSDLEDIMDSADQQLLTDESEQNLNFGARYSEIPQVNEISDSEGFSYKNESIEISDEESPEMKVAEVHSKMKRSYEMTFQPEPKVLTQDSPQGEHDEKLRTSLDEGSIFSTSMSSTSSIGTQRTVIDCDRMETSTGTSEHVSLEDVETAPKSNLENVTSVTLTTDISTSTSEANTGMLIESVTLTTSSVDIDGVQSVCTQVTSDEHAVADEITSLTFTEPKKKGHKRNESVLMGSNRIIPAQFEEEEAIAGITKASKSFTQEESIVPLEKAVVKSDETTSVKARKVDDADILHVKYFAVKTDEFLEAERAAARNYHSIDRVHDAKYEKLEKVPEEPSPKQPTYIPDFDLDQSLEKDNHSAEENNQSKTEKKEIVDTVEDPLLQIESSHKFLEKEGEISEKHRVLEEVVHKKAAKGTEEKCVDEKNKIITLNQISSSAINEFLENERSIAEKYKSTVTKTEQITTKIEAQSSTSMPKPIINKADSYDIAVFLEKEKEICEKYTPIAQTNRIDQAKDRVSTEPPEIKSNFKESDTSAIKEIPVDITVPSKISSSSISHFLEKEREASTHFKSDQDNIQEESKFEERVISAPTDKKLREDIDSHVETLPDVDIQKFLDYERESCDVYKQIDSNKPITDNETKSKISKQPDLTSSSLISRFIEKERDAADSYKPIEKIIKEATVSSIAQEKYKKDKIISNDSHKQPEGKVVFSKVPPCLSPAHKVNQICPIMEDDISEKHELEKQETMKKKLEEKRKEIMEDYNLPDITVTQHMAPLVDDDFRYPDLELEAKEKLAGGPVVTETPQTPASNSSKSSEETDLGQEYIVTEPAETICEEPEEDSPESKVEIKSLVDSKTEEGLEKETDSLGSSESFEMLDKPDIIDDFVVIEEIGKEADELDSEGKSVKIAKVQKHKKKHDQEEDDERYLAHSAPTPLTTTKISDVKYFPEDDFEESPPQVQGTKNGAYSTRDYIDRELEANRKWVEQQFQGDHASIMAAGYGYEMEFERGPLEDIKEEDITDFAASSYGSQKDSGGSLKESYSSTPEYDVLAGRKYFTRSGEHDDASMSSLQEFEKLEQAMSLEMRKLHQSSQDSSSNGSFKTRYTLSKGGQGSDVSVSSLKEFEGLEKACIAAHKIEVKVKEEEALLDQIEEGQESITSESEGCETISRAEKKLVKDTDEEEDYEKRIFEIDEIIKQAQTNVERFIDLKDIEQTESLGRGDSVEEVSKVPDLDLDAPIVKSTIKVQWKENGDVMLNSTDSLEAQLTQPAHHQSVDSLDQELIGAVKSSSSDSIEMEAKKYSKDSLDVHESDKTYMVSSDSLETGGPMQSVDPNVITSDSIDEDSSRFGIYDHSHSSTGRDFNSSAKDELSHERDQVECRDNLDISSSTATHATYQYETDSVFSGSFTSGGSNTMVSSTNSIDQGKQSTAVDLEAAARKVWFEETEGKFLADSSKPYVTEIIEPCEDEFFTHTINRTVELPTEIRKVTITGPDADLKMKQFIQDFEEGEECVETQEMDADGNIHIRRVVKRRFVVKDDSGQLPTSEIEKYFKELQPDAFKEKEFDSSAPSSSKISKVTRDVQEVSESKGDQPTPSMKATRRRPLRYEISVEDQTEVDPREHDWRFNLPKHAEGEEGCAETDESNPSH